eukprot:5028332-Ditylum_brightwellii.AAC.1
MDNTNAMTGLNTTFQKTAQYVCIKTSTIKTHTPQQNPQERQIGELSQQSRDKRRKKNIPIRLWDFVLVFIAASFSVTWNARTGRTVP